MLPVANNRKGKHYQDISIEFYQDALRDLRCPGGHAVKTSLFQPKCIDYGSTSKPTLSDDLTSDEQAILAKMKELKERWSCTRHHAQACFVNETGGHMHLSTALLRDWGSELAAGKDGCSLDRPPDLRHFTEAAVTVPRGRKGNGIGQQRSFDSLEGKIEDLASSLKRKRGDNDVSDSDADEDPQLELEQFLKFFDNKYNQQEYQRFDDLSEAEIYFDTFKRLANGKEVMKDEVIQELVALGIPRARVRNMIGSVKPFIASKRQRVF